MLAENCRVVKTSTVAALGETATVEFDWLVTVTMAEPDLEVSAWDVPVTLTWAGAGTVEGAVYTPAAVMVPFAAPPTTLQFTAVFEVPVTVAVNV
jgi:hypothetical protein